MGEMLTTGGIGSPGAGGEIFSKLKAGMVHPLVIESEHSRSSPRCRWFNPDGKPFPQV
jgi:hypothetical protein